MIYSYRAAVRCVLLLCIVLALAELGTAQGNRITEREVKLQQLMLDASREHLLGNDEKAIELLREASKEDRESGIPQFQLAKIYAETEQPREALPHAKKAVDAQPANLWYLQQLADIHQELNQNQEAASIMERIVELQPGNPQHYDTWAYLLVNAQDIKSALKVYDLQEKRMGVSEGLIRRKHALYYGMRDDKRAAAEIQRLIDAYPTEVDYRYDLADFYLTIDEPKKAEAVYRDILKIDPDEPRAKLALSGKGSGKQKEIEFVNSLRPIFGQPEVDLQLKLKQFLPLTRQAADTDDPQLVQATLDLAALLESTHPSDAQAIAAHATLLHHADQPAAALNKYQQALEADDTDFDIWSSLMELQIDQADYQSLLSTSETAMDYFPNQATAYLHHAHAAFILGNPRTSTAILPQALLMASRDAALVTQMKCLLGLAQQAQGKADKAYTTLSTLYAEQPDEPQIKASYAYLCAQQQRELKKALDLAKAVTKADPASATAWQAQAIALLNQNNFATAQSALTRAAALPGQPSPITLELQGDAELGLGNVPAALQYWKAAQQAGRKTKELAGKIAERS